MRVILVVASLSALLATCGAPSDDETASASQEGLIVCMRQPDTPEPPISQPVKFWWRCGSQRPGAGGRCPANFSLGADGYCWGWYYEGASIWSGFWSRSAPCCPAKPGGYPSVSCTLDWHRTDYCWEI
jgi:hypothetical protein